MPQNNHRPPTNNPHPPVLMTPPHFSLLPYPGHHPNSTGLLPTPGQPQMQKMNRDRKRLREDEENTHNTESVQTLYQIFKRIEDDRTHRRHLHELQSRASNLVTKILELIRINLNNDMQDWRLRQRPDQDIANLIYVLAALQDKHLINLPHDDYSFLTHFAFKLVDYIEFSRNPSHAISSTLHAIACLTNHGLINYLTDYMQNALFNLLNTLKNNIGYSDKPTQDIAQSLYALGCLARHGLITSLPNDTKNAFFDLLQTLKDKIRYSDKPTQDIANSLYVFRDLVSKKIVVMDDALQNCVTELTLHVCEHLHNADQPVREIVQIFKTLVSLFNWNNQHTHDAVQAILHALFHQLPSQIEQRYQSQPRLLIECLQHLQNFLKKGVRFEDKSFITLLASFYLPEQDSIQKQSHHCAILREVLAAFELPIPDQINSIIAPLLVDKNDENQESILQSLGAVDI